MFKDRNGLLAGVAFLLLGLISLMILIPYGIDVPSNVRLAVLSPSYYPRLVSIALAIIGAAVIARAAGTGASDERAYLSIAAMAKALIVILVLLGSAFALPHAGFVVTCTGALATLMLIGGERRPWLIASVSLALPMLLHFFFTKVANVPIPEGILRHVWGGI